MEYIVTCRASSSGNVCIIDYVRQGRLASTVFTLLLYLDNWLDSRARGRRRALTNCGRMSDVYYTYIYVI